LLALVLALLVGIMVSVILARMATLLKMGYARFVRAHALYAVMKRFVANALMATSLIIMHAQLASLNA
jgi:hypothetical protein